MIETLRILERQTGGVAANLPHLSDPGAIRVARKLSVFPDVSPASAMNQAYPHHIIAKVDQGGGDDDEAEEDFVTAAIRRFELGDPSDVAVGYKLVDVQRGSSSEGTAELTLEGASGVSKTVSVPCGPVRTDWRETFEALLPEQRETVTAMLMDHATDTDLCVLGGPGSGKTTIVRAFAAILGYVVSTVHFFQDMTSRDILQRRGTDIDGNTKWDNTTVIRAAVLGELAILDGTHRIPSDVLAIMQRLCLDRDIELFDGTRLMRWDRYDATRTRTGLSDDEMADRQIYRIHEAFRIIAVGEPPSAQSSRWLTSELVSFFSFHEAPQISGARLESVMSALYPTVEADAMHTLISFAEALRIESTSTVHTLS
jgi:MoxR-like ATPase